MNPSFFLWHDAELVDIIVSRVKTLLDYKDLFITEYPVGLESRVEDVIKCIENESSKVCMIGIWGIGGSGKTTIAKAIYNRIYRQFIGKSFIEFNRYQGHVALQQNLLSNVLKSKLKVASVEIGRTMVQNGFSRKKFLLVLDDVNSSGQFENLYGSYRWFGQGSVIIITSRNVSLLNRLEVNYVYQTHPLNENESLELFSWHAFKEAKPRKEWSLLARNVVVYCGGLPLTLQFLGSYLYDRTIEVWESVLLKLQRIPPDELLSVLKICFEDLRDTEKDIFLDVCCFFVGKERDYVTEILNDCGLHADIGITVLIQRGLIKVERNNKLQVHPLLQHMGREIIRQECPEKPGKRSRLWFQDDVKDVLIHNTGTEAIKGLSLKLHSTSRDCFKAHSFKKMKRLRLLQLDHGQLSGDYGHISEQLRCICWRGFPYKHIPSNFHLQNVIAMDLKHSHLQLLWKQPQVLERLKFLNLSHSKYLIQTPDFSGLPSLEQLILKDCPSLLKVHQSIADLSNIVLINLKDCTSLSYLPREIYKLTSLKTLILSGCSKLRPLEKI
ncbi:TMV resistance protein N-like [Vigna radiata var. radiata]|uniref:TMV resistance protein N-like n=1 Tax=Vigna radiata var. radiata TaxID=3916 RepID=A0A3Q0FH30_VIGRR|nr:TMV resistance protein N-like [Vigna radiata var. radiata]